MSIQAAERRAISAEHALAEECKNSRRLADKLAAVAKAWDEWKPNELDALLAPHRPGAAPVLENDERERS